MFKTRKLENEPKTGKCTSSNTEIYFNYFAPSLLKHQRFPSQMHKIIKMRYKTCKSSPKQLNLDKFHCQVAAAVTFIVINIILCTLIPDVIECTTFDDNHQQPHNHRQAHFVELDDSNKHNNVQRIAVGRPVTFKCVVENLGSHKVSWFHRDRRLLLAIDNKTFTWHDRIQVSSQADKVFFLQINSVQLSDKGQFNCQLNTQPTQSQAHILDVVKSPHIRDQETTVNIEPVKEFNSVELRCVADGIPKPTIKWRRESQTHELPAFNQDEEEEEENIENNELDEYGRQPSSWQDRSSDSKVLSKSQSDSAHGSQMASKASTVMPDVADIDEKHVVSSQYLNGHDASSLESQKDASYPLSERLQRRQATQSSVTLMKEAGDNPLINGGHIESAVADVDSQILSKPTRIIATRSAASQLSTELSSSTQTTSQANNFSLNHQQQRQSFLAEGEVLRLNRVSRYDMGFYICIASNGVQPSVSQRIFLPVSFAPMRATAASGRKNTRNREESSDDEQQASSSSSSSGNTTGVHLAEARDLLASASYGPVLNSDHFHGKTAANSGLDSPNLSKDNEPLQDPAKSKQSSQKQQSRQIFKATPVPGSLEEAVTVAVTAQQSLLQQQQQQRYHVKSTATKDVNLNNNSKKRPIAHHQGQNNINGISIEKGGGGGRNGTGTTTTTSKNYHQRNRQLKAPRSSASSSSSSTTSIHSFSSFISSSTITSTKTNIFSSSPYLCIDQIIYNNQFLLIEVLILLLLKAAGFEWV